MSENNDTRTNNDPNKVHWSATASYPMFAIFDARCLFPILIWAFHICWDTFYIAIAGVLFFSGLSYFNITPIVCLRSIRTKISGSRRAKHDTTIYRRRIK